MRVRTLAAGALGALCLGLGAGPGRAEPPPSGPVECDRACLRDLVDQTLAAMVAHDARRLPLAPDVRYTENGQALTLNDGFWGTASGQGVYKHYFLDPRSGQAGFMGVMKESGSNVIIAMRLRLEGRKISEIETVFSRTGLGQASPNGSAMLESMGGPDAVWLKDVPPAERASRQDIVRVANMYFSGLENNDGKGVYPFTDDCYRLESGVQTTAGPHPTPPRPAPPPGTPAPPPRPGPNLSAMSCKAGFETGYFRIDTRIRDRRFALVDEDKGVAFAFVFFDHNGTVHNYKLTDGTVIPGGPSAPFTWEIVEAFRIEKGNIRVVEAVLNNVPYGMKGGWNGH
jgi:hypothetical protein